MTAHPPINPPDRSLSRPKHSLPPADHSFSLPSLAYVVIGDFFQSRPTSRLRSGTPCTIQLANAGYILKRYPETAETPNPPNKFRWSSFGANAYFAFRILVLILHYTAGLGTERQCKVFLLQKIVNWLPPSGALGPRDPPRTRGRRLFRYSKSTTPDYSSRKISTRKHSYYRIYPAPWFILINWSFRHKSILRLILQHHKPVPDIIWFLIPTDLCARSTIKTNPLRDFIRWQMQHLTAHIYPPIDKTGLHRCYL